MAAVTTPSWRSTADTRGTIHRRSWGLHARRRWPVVAGGDAAPPRRWVMLIGAGGLDQLGGQVDVASFVTCARWLERRGSIRWARARGTSRRGATGAPPTPCPQITIVDQVRAGALHGSAPPPPPRRDADRDRLFGAVKPRRRRQSCLSVVTRSPGAVGTIDGAIT